MNRARIRVVLLTSLASWGLHGQSIYTVAGGSVGDGGPANVARVALPNRAAVDAPGNLYIADLYNNRIRRVDAATQIITTIAGMVSLDSRATADRPPLLRSRSRGT